MPDERLVTENAALRAENTELRVAHDELKSMFAVATEQVAVLEGVVRA